MLRGQAGGEFFAQCVMPTWHAAVRRKCWDNANSAATRTILTLRLRRVALRRLPALGPSGRAHPQ
jgi:hypothetical protein